MATLEQLNGGNIESFGHTNHPSLGEDFLTGSVLIGEEIQTVEFSLKTGSGTVSRDITFTVRNSSGVLLHTFGTFPGSSVTGSFTMIGANTPTSYVTGLADSDILCAEMSADNTNYLHQDRSSSDEYSDGRYVDNPASSPSTKTFDAVFRVTYGAPEPVPSGTRLPPPPIVLGGL